ncbi:MAG: hypothetical protein HYX35_03840 [Proteobacteria bacterium]|nr:hypothetical protein [Pseudomonadota bacterium]
MLKKSLISAAVFATLVAANSEAFSEGCPRGQIACNATYSCWAGPVFQVIAVGTASVPVCTALPSCPDTLYVSDVTSVPGTSGTVTSALQAACNQDLEACHNNCQLPDDGKLSIN